MAKKQYDVELAEPQAAIAFIFSPLWLIGAIIRQVFIEKWK